MNRRHLVAFVILTFAVSWGNPGAVLLASRLIETVTFSLAMYSPLYYVGVWGPALSALLVIGWVHGPRGLAAFAGRMLDWRFPGRWWAFALLGIPALYLLAALGHGWADGTPGLLAAWDFSLLPFIAMVLARATAGPVEELGWRGFAQPMLQRYVHPATAILIIAAIHAVWHFPVFVVGQFAHFGTELALVAALARFSAQILAVTVIFAIAYNATGGSLTLAFVIHLMLNLAYPWEGDVDLLTGQTVVLAAAALVMAVALGPRWLRREHAPTAVMTARTQAPSR